MYLEAVRLPAALLYSGAFRPAKAIWEPDFASYGSFVDDGGDSKALAEHFGRENCVVAAVGVAVEYGDASVPRAVRHAGLAGGSLADFYRFGNRLSSDEPLVFCLGRRDVYKRQEYAL